MANEVTTTTANDVYFASIVTDAILNELRPMNVMRPFMRRADAGNSLSYDFPIQDTLAASNVTSPLAEGADLSNTAMTTSKATATAAQIGIMATVTDLLSKVSLIDALPHFSGVLSRTMAEKVETDFAANLANFSNVTDAGGTQTVAKFLAATAALEQRDVVGRIVAVLHPKAAGEIRSDLTTQTGTYWSRDNQQPDSGITQEHFSAGYVGALFGVPIFQSTLVPTSDAAAKRAGALFVANEALGLYELWGVRTELQRDASKVATEVVLTACYGTVEISDTRGQTLKSTA
jgi:hypothetical protein